MITKILFILVLLCLLSCEQKSQTKHAEVNPQNSNSISKETPFKNDTLSIKIEDLKYKLQGEWISIEDSNYILEFIGDTVYDKYIGDSESDIKSKFTLGDSCPDDQVSNSSINNQMILVKEDDEMCYTLDYVNESSLQLTDLPRGNTLSFTRKK